MLQAQQAAASAHASWQDVDGRRREELTSMTGGGGILPSFYAALDECRAVHRRAASAGEGAAETRHGTDVHSNVDAAAQATFGTFTNEELYGRFVDLVSLFDEFCNLPSVKDARYEVSTRGRAAVPEDARDVLEQGAVEYSTWLVKLPEMHSTLPGRVKGSKQYRRYITSLARYLLHFLQRRAPLLDAQELMGEWAKAFDTAWEAGQVAGWSTTRAGAGEAASSSIPSSATPPSLVDLTPFTSPEEVLAELGAEGCKAQLQARGLKAGGSPEERATRLFSVKDLAPEAYPKKLRAEAAAVGGVKGVAGTGSGKQGTPVDTAAAQAEAGGSSHNSTALSSSTSLSALPALDPSSWGTGRYGGTPLHSTACAAWVEHCACACARLLADVLQDTRRRVQRRATRTFAELQADREVEEAEVGAERGAAAAAAAALEVEEDEGAPIYNPLNIPLGWDGKPIPYWLYKLHGLNIEYSCEICGGASYKGRRDFDRHFQEWKHAAGMRALGIPNTKHFHDITRIADAKECKYQAPPAPPSRCTRCTHVILLCMQCTAVSSMWWHRSSGRGRGREGRSTRTAAGTS